MNDLVLIKKIKELSPHAGCEALEKIEALIEEKLRHEPNNIAWWLRLAILEETVPLADCDKSVACLERALSIQDDNPIALLLLAYMKDTFYGGIDEKLLYKLGVVCTDDNELNAMISFAISWFYADKRDHVHQEHFLKKSIASYQGHVWNYVHLARLYLKIGRANQVPLLVNKAIANVSHIYSCDPNEESDLTDVNEFINEHIKGVHLTDINFNGIKELTL